MKNRSVLFFGGIVLALTAVGFIFTRKPDVNTTTQIQPTEIVTEKKELQVGEDICNEFPKEWVSGVINKPIVKTEKMDSSGTHVCQYFIDETNFITLRLNNLNVENQKKGQIVLGRSITTNETICLENMVVMQPDGKINEIILVLNPDLFIAIDRSSIKAASETEILSFAEQVATRIQNGDNKNVTFVSPTEKKDSVVPLPQETDIINSFFQIIGEHRPSDAVMMMTPQNTNDDSTKQAWGVQFNAFKSIQVKSIEPSMQSDWTDNTHTYKVILQVEMKPEAASAQPMPNYGWDNGENIRWVSLEKVNDKWMINGIGTGP